MNARDRFFATLRHERPDRPPLDVWLRPELLRALRERLGRDDPLDELGMDFRSAGIGERNEAFLTKAAEPKGGDWPGSHGRYVWHDDRTFEDAWGVVHQVGRDGKLIEWIRGPLVDADDPDEFAFPGLDNLLRPEDVAPRVAALKRRDKVVMGGMSMPFKRAWYLRGLENWLCDLVANQAFAERLYDKIYAYETERAVRAAKAGVDVVTVTGDIAMNNQLLFSPEVFRKLDKPRLAVMVQRVREVNPAIQIYLHSDGDMSEVMDDFIDVGFTCINPIQPECMDPNEVKRRWGDAITLWGTISVRTTIPQGTPASIRQEVHERIRRCGHDGGLVVGPANVIMWDTPVENVVAFCDAVREFCWDH